MFAKIHSPFATRSVYSLRRAVTGVAAITRAMCRTRPATIKRYAGWGWSDRTERVLNDDLTSKRAHPFPP